MLTRADVSIKLVVQLTTAKLNVASGADPAVIVDTRNDADAWLAMFAGKLPYNVHPSSPEGKLAMELTEQLEGFNTGTLAGGPVSCDALLTYSAFGR